MMRYIPILWIITLLSCDKQIPYDDVNFKPKLVINSFNQSDSLLKIKLDESFKLLGNPSSDKLNLAIKIKLLRDSLNIIDGTFWVADGEVILPHKVNDGSTYYLSAELENYPSIQTNDQVPIDNVSMSLDSIIEGSVYYQLDMTIEDPLFENYYVLDLSLSGKELILNDSMYKKYPITFSSIDKIFSSSIQTISEGSKIVLFDDDLFNGTEKSIGIRIPKDSVDILGFKAYSLNVRLKSVSESMYNYYIMLIQNNHVFGGPLYFEGQIEGNIDGGLGGFYFYNEYSDSIPYRF